MTPEDEKHVGKGLGSLNFSTRTRTRSFGQKMAELDLDFRLENVISN